MDNKKDRAFGALLGLAVGDAVGTTLEFTLRDSYTHLTDMVGGGPFDLRVGEWTDDTSMALCLADSLIAHDAVLDQADLLSRFVNWYRFGHNSTKGVCFDIGGATTAALVAFETSQSLINNEAASMQANGSIMRLSPTVICARTIDEAFALADSQGITTHAAPVPRDCCRDLASILWAQIETGDKHARAALAAEKNRDVIISSGHAPATLEAACWAVATTGNFRDAVLAAANLGDDADTVAAVAGQIAGSLYGAEAIPEDWFQKLFWHDEIVERCEALWAIREAK